MGILSSSLHQALVKVLTQLLLNNIADWCVETGGIKVIMSTERCLSLGPYSLSTPSYHPIQSSFPE